MLEVLIKFKKLPFLSPFNQSPVYFIPETTSTMDEAIMLNTHGVLAGTVVVTDFQTAGKGRLPNRKWEACRGENILLTIILDNRFYIDKPTYIPLAAGLAVCTLLEEKTGLAPRIRWPNDVLLNEKKVSGILCKIKGKYLYIGIGINLNQSEFSPELYLTATSVFNETNIKYNRDEFLKVLLEKLFFVFSMDDVLNQIKKRLWLLNEACIYTNGDGGCQIQAIISGLGKNGELLIKPNESDHEILCISGNIRKK